MDTFSWLAQVEDLSSAALTVRAQALPPDDRDRLIHDIFFPRRNVDSVKLSNFLTTDFRPVASRREWNTRGRIIPTQTFKRQEIEMIPIETYFTVAEKEMQHLLERTDGEEAVIRRLLGIEIPTRIDSLVNANRRLMEVDALRAWANGNIVLKNPQTGVETTVSYGFDASRYQTAATAWNDAGLNAYDEFLAWVEDGNDTLGQAATGAVMRKATYQAIQADAPQGLNAIPLTRSQFENQFRQDLGTDFTFYLVEHQLDLPVDGGLDFTRTKVWPAEKVALVPAGVAVGSMAYAPVARAFELARVHQDAEIDVRGMSVFKEIAGNGREATWECQVNSFPVPDEQLMWVIDAGV